MTVPGIDGKRSGVAAGRDRGHITTLKASPQKASQRKGFKGKRTGMIREVIRETCGFAPYEKRVMELIKMGSASSLKRALKYAKKRLGSHTRGKKKREELTEAIMAQRKKH